MDFMKPRECFGVILRTVGVIVLFVSGLYLYSAGVALLFPETPHVSTPPRYLLAFALTLAVGLYFLRGAPHLMRFAYGDDRPDSDDKSNDA
jgi:hypothetical protein